jgi:hypothetical protein
MGAEGDTIKEVQQNYGNVLSYRRVPPAIRESEWQGRAHGDAARPILPAAEIMFGRISLGFGDFPPSYQGTAM